MFQIGQRKCLCLKKVGNMFSVILMVKWIVGVFYEKELQKTNQKEFRVEKVIKKKDSKVYVISKGYDSSFSSRIDKKDII